MDQKPETIQVGTRVRSLIYVLGGVQPAHVGIVTRVSPDGTLCLVDRMSLHGGAPWLVWEATSHLRVEPV